MLRFCATYKDVKLFKQNFEKLKEIFSTEIIYDFKNYDTPYQERLSEVINVVKVDSMLLFVAKFPEMFAKLTEETKIKIILACISRYSIAEISLHSASSVFRHTIKESSKIMVDIVKGKYESFITENYAKLFGNRSNIFNIILDTLLEHNTDINALLFEFYDYLKINKQEMAKDFRFYSYMLENSDEFFIRYFTDSDEWSFLRLENSHCEDFCFENFDKHFILTEKKLKYLKELWKDIKDDNPSIKLLLKIMTYINYRTKYLNFEEIYMFYPDYEEVEEMLSDADESDLEFRENVIEDIGHSFDAILDRGFIEPRNSLVLIDGSPENCRLFFRNTRDLRKLFKWHYGDVGYGSPTYPTECFINWDKHKAEFPEYDEMRKQVLTDK